MGVLPKRRLHHFSPLPLKQISNFSLPDFCIRCGCSRPSPGSLFLLVQGSRQRSRQGELVTKGIRVKFQASFPILPATRPATWVHPAFSFSLSFSFPFGYRAISRRKIQSSNRPREYRFRFKFHRLPPPRELNVLACCCCSEADSPSAKEAHGGHSSASSRVCFFKRETTTGVEIR